MRTLVISSRPSRSATALARALGIRKLATSGNRIARPIRLLNWGCGVERFNERYMNRLLHRTMEGARYINSPESVRVATNKLLTFQRLSEDPEIPIPEFTTDPIEAVRWESDIVERHSLTGHSGEGIRICPYVEGRDEGVVLDEFLEDAPLYVKYMKKKHEYRVHVVLGRATVQDSTVQGEHTDVQQKRKRQETNNDEVNYQVRNHANGWVYCREELSIPQGMEALAVRVVRQLGLDFGAVDIIWNQKSNQMTVLELNSAPGLEGQTLEFYREHLGNLISQRG